MVAPCCVKYLSRRPENQITVACRTFATAQSLAAKFSRTKALALDVSQTSQLSEHLPEYDVVISLVPYKYHEGVIKAAIKGKTQVVTTSYVSDAVRALDGEAKAAGITVWNEVGVDPGVGHCYAIKKIEEVHANGGKVLEFYSYCGGLPAPECADNPLGFRFSCQVVEIGANDLMGRAAPYFVMKRYDFVAYPNRDSVPFRDFYRIPEAHTVVRGSLRYKGKSALIQALANLGWLEQDEKNWLRPSMSWAQIQQELLGASATDEAILIQRIKEIASFPDEAEGGRIISGMKWIGILSSEEAPIVGQNLLDTLCARLEKIMSFEPGQRDLVMLQHKFVIAWPDRKKETTTSTLELFGQPNGYFGMQLAVGVTCGIATQYLLDGHNAFAKPGVQAPYEKTVCDLSRASVEKEGVEMTEAIV